MTESQFTELGAVSARTVADEPVAREVGGEYRTCPECRGRGITVMPPEDSVREEQARQRLELRAQLDAMHAEIRAESDAATALFWAKVAES